MAAPRSDLPSADIVRWSPNRKASVVEGVQDGVISLDEACRRYHISEEEFRTWQVSLQAHGIGSLRTTRCQLYRG
jgi:transposase-like protein